MSEDGDSLRGRNDSESSADGELRLEPPCERWPAARAAADELSEICRGLVAGGAVPSCQIAVAHDGDLMLHGGFGANAARSRYIIFSATKPIVASAVHLLHQNAQIDLSAPVASYIREFGANGKENVSVEQLLLHTAGLPGAWLDPERWSDPTERRHEFAQWELEYVPGDRFVYHGSSAHWVLADLIETATGSPYQDFIEAEVFRGIGPLNMTMGVRDGAGGSVMPVQEVEVPTGSGRPEAPGSLYPNSHFLRYNDPFLRSLGTPSSGCIADAASLALFYQALCGNLPGPWDRRHLSAATTTVRNTLEVDGSPGVSANRSLGWMVSGRGHTEFRQRFGDSFTRFAFGHPGAAGQMTWADPSSGWSVAFLSNGLDAARDRVHRQHRVLSECVLRHVSDLG